ncbi:MAG: ParA family protein [Lachnospiraceae bacterium]|nr:ParA family protein [Lachnospiraceae bacterium]
MSRCIAVANQKGGVGKTTVTINLAAALSSAGKRILVIDADPQGNTTSGFGVDKNAQEHTVYELLLGEADADAVISRLEESGVDLIPANVDLAAAEIELIDVDGKEYRLKNAVEPVKDRYDFILIDCPPSLSMLTINAMTTADTVLVPIQCEYYALEGLSQLVKTVDLVRERLNPALEMEGVVFTMYDARTRLSAQVVDNVRDHIREHVFKTIIPRNIRLAEAPSYGRPINLYEPKSAGTEAFRLLAEEVMERAI